MDLSGGLEDSRRAESGVSWTRFDTHPTLTISICQMRDIYRIGYRFRFRMFVVRSVTLAGSYRGGSSFVSVDGVDVSLDGVDVLVDCAGISTSRSFALRVTTIPTEVTAGGVFELAVAFGADADHVRHDRADWRLSAGG